MYSRLFIVCDKRCTENDFQEVFSRFGYIESIRIPRYRNTGQSKGVVYIKYSKTSEAAAALEAMHQNTLRESTFPLKVMVAANRSEIQTDDDDEGKYTRLFISVPITATEDELRKIFSQYGRVQSVQLHTDRYTREPKGFAYVKFNKFSDSTRAFENCDRKYKPLFATLKGNSRHLETNYESNISNLANTASNLSTMISMMPSRSSSYTQVSFTCSRILNKTQVESLFDIVPGMIICMYYTDLAYNCGKGTVSYSNTTSAAYAVEKLNNFEYPPGSRIWVMPNNYGFDGHDYNTNNVNNITNKLRNTMRSIGTATPDLARLADAVAEASELIKVATSAASDGNTPDSGNLNYCSVKLPSPKPLAHIDSVVAKRCFLVCKPQPPPLTVLRDVFCRFGDLINVYTFPNKTIGYARYASVKAANAAIKTLHGAELCGVRMKVLEAEEEAPPHKRRKGSPDTSVTDNSHDTSRQTSLDIQMTSLDL